jgi:hypothetical protein
MIQFLLSPVYRAIGIAAAILLAIGAVYTKGRSDASNRNKLKNYKATQDAIEKATAARRASNASGLHNNDGFRRD